jgi:hypothetical protein
MFSKAQSDALELYSKLKFISIPVHGKRPFFKNWNAVEHTPRDLSVFNGNNIGILTGKVSKITILDIDSKDDGVIIFNKIKKLYPEFKSPMVYTPGKGYHIYFKYNPRLLSISRLRLNGKRIGWDVLNNDRQAVAPPSIIDNKKYKWIHSPLDTEIINMPEWLESYILLLKSN